jgi:hypothetical protein
MAQGGHPEFKTQCLKRKKKKEVESKRTMVRDQAGQKSSFGSIKAGCGGSHLSSQLFGET